MKKLSISLIVLIPIIFLPSTFADSTPDWVKNTAGWWATDKISEDEFVNAIEFLINDGIIKVTVSNTFERSEKIPDWVKNTAGWWATDKISEDEFLDSMKFLIKFGIIDVVIESSCHDELKKISNDLKKIEQVCEKSNLNELTELIPFEPSMNINKKGFIGDDFPTKKPDNEFRIFIIGGSVVQGLESSSPDTTIPSILQAMIDHNNNENNVKIINAANSAGNSLYQKELVKSLLKNYEPDMILILSGWNDLSADYPVRSLVDIVKQTCEIVNENNSNLMIFLQPIAGFGNKILTEQEKINSLTGEDHNGYQLIQAKSSYDYLARELETFNYKAEVNFGKCSVIDIRDTFDEISGSIYLDQGHISDTGNFIIADRFLKELSKNFSDTFSYDEKFYNIISNYNHISITDFLLSQLNIEVDYSSVSLKDVMKMQPGKGDYFKLKNKFGIDGILVGKDLRNIDLNDLVLDGQDLTGANLSGQDLRNIDLTNTIIRNANLSYTNLEGINFSGMDLRGIDFSNSNMKNVDFRDAKFSKHIQMSAPNCEDGIYPDFVVKTEKDGIVMTYKVYDCMKDVIQNESMRTNFSNADLTNSKFGNIQNEIVQQINFIDFSNADLTNSAFHNVQLSGCNFNNAVLNNATLAVLFVSETDFTNAEMNNLEISHAWFQSVSFDNTWMKEGQFYNITFIETDFTNADLEGTSISKLYEFNNNFNCKNSVICKK